MAEHRVKFEACTDDFFKIAPRKLAIEVDPFCGRTYFLHDGKIVAVARNSESADAPETRRLP